MSSGQCQQCGSTDIDTDPARGDSVCTQCGSVLEEAGIVSDVQYAPDSRGVSRAVGQFVNSEDGRPYGLNNVHGIRLGRQSRTITCQKAKQSIQALASKLRLNTRQVESAFAFYKLALARHLTKGRNSTQVIAACVYMVCRKDGTEHMLLDFSDILQISVYELGKTYLKLTTALHIKAPVLDPSVYINRFAYQLELGKKCHDVTITAARLVQRMKKDWMHTGRRPSGLCGAALLVAARLHGFNRTVDDIIKVVKVCQATVRKRLAEFIDTPSSRLTLDEFMTIDLEEEQDPPAFKNARKKMHELEDEQKMTNIKKQVLEIQQILEKTLESTKKRSRFSKYAESCEDSSNSSFSNSLHDDNVDMIIAENTVHSLQEVIGKDLASDSGVSDVSGLAPILMKETVSIACSEQSSESDCVKGPEPTAESIGLKDSIEDCLKIPEHLEMEENDTLDLTGLDDDELDNYLMDPFECKRKDLFWHKHNADYLQILKEKEERKAREEAENANKPEKRRKKRLKKDRTESSTAGEAIQKLIQRRKISSKLDYDVLKNLSCKSPVPELGNQTTDVSINEQTELPVRRSAKKPRPKPMQTIPLNIKRGMSDIIGTTRKQEPLTDATDEDQILVEEQSAKKIKISDVELEEPPTTIILDDGDDNVEPEETVEQEEEDEEYESDEEYKMSSLPKEDVPDYYDYDEYVDDYDD